LGNHLPKIKQNRKSLILKETQIGQSFLTGGFVMLGRDLAHQIFKTLSNLSASAASSNRTPTTPRRTDNSPNLRLPALKGVTLSVGTTLFTGPFTHAIAAR
jgi:hypothetical protein